jgi:hypothetical protein
MFKMVSKEVKAWPGLSKLPEYKMRRLYSH